MKLLLALLLGVFCVVDIYGKQEIEPGVSIELATARKANISDVEYDLKLNIVKTGPISSSVVVRFRSKNRDANVVLDFNAKPEKLKRFSMNGVAVEPDIGNEHVVFPAKLLREGVNEISIDFEAGEQSLNRNPEFLFTLLVPDRASTLFPCFDQPDLKAKFKLTLSMPDDWIASANGGVAKETVRNHRRLVSYHRTKPISTYLFAFAVGDFQRVTRLIGGREVSMLHRESDAEKVARNVDAIFAIHELALDWMEDYTKIEYPFGKFDFVLIPSFQYGGMEHIGNIFYNADQLFLDKSATKNQKLNRASLIAHETAHMWFGDLVTMNWFNDVWLKEVFANFMAAKIVHPSFPDINHDLGFLLKHHPSAYGEDRSEGTYPIQQRLSNLKNAGTLYGRIIYMKAPVVMRQLETLIGPENLQDGLREYLNKFSYGNAAWDDLIEILDRKTELDLKQWSETWVKEAGTPVVSEPEVVESRDSTLKVVVKASKSKSDSAWTQQVDFRCVKSNRVIAARRLTLRDRLEMEIPADYDFYLVNGSELGYGFFSLDEKSKSFLLGSVEEVADDVIRGAAYLALYESMIRDKVNGVRPSDLFETLLRGIACEKEPLNRQNLLSQSQTVLWRFIEPGSRQKYAERLEAILWKWIEDQWQDREPCTEDAKSAYFKTLLNIAATDETIRKLRVIFEKEQPPGDLSFSELDYISLAYELALRLPEEADAILRKQLARIENADRKKRFEFVSPTLSADPVVRDRFFESLSVEENRRPERWALEGLHYLHHPLRAAESEKYILPGLLMLEEIQKTGDIFFPKRWLVETLSGHRSASAAQTVRSFLAARPDYSPNLRNKILQAADLLFRAAED